MSKKNDALGSTTRSRSRGVDDGRRAVEELQEKTGRGAAQPRKKA